MTFWMVSICPEGAMFKIWLKSVEFKGIKNSLKDGWHCWRFGGCWRFLTGADILDHDKDVSFKVHQVSVSNFVKIWCLAVELWSVQFCQIWCLRRGVGGAGEIGELKDQPRLINSPAVLKKRFHTHILCSGSCKSYFPFPESQHSEIWNVLAIKLINTFSDFVLNFG